MEDEAEPVLRRGTLIFPNHPAIGVERAFVDGLAGDEGKADLTRIVVGRRGDRPADPAAIPLAVDEAVPVNAGGPEAGGKHPRGPVSLGQDGDRGRRHDPLEFRILGHLNQQLRAVAALIGTPGPQHDAVIGRVARGNAFGVEVAAFGPTSARWLRASTGPGQAGASRGRDRHELAPVIAARSHSFPLSSPG